MRTFCATLSMTAAVLGNSVLKLGNCSNITLTRYNAISAHVVCDPTLWPLDPYQPINFSKCLAVLRAKPLKNFLNASGFSLSDRKKIG